MAAGAFSLCIEDATWSLRIVERGANRRSRWFNRPYGDQGIFLRRETFEKAGGYPDMPIMEDYEFVTRLGKLGKVGTLPQAVLTSGRRWRKLGVSRSTALNQCIIAGYYVGVSPARLAVLYGRRGGEDQQSDTNGETT